MHSPRQLTPVLLLSGLLLLATAALPRVVAEMPDFEVYWRAGGRVMAAEPLYRPEDGHFQHKYLPAFGVIAAPLALFSLRTAKILWFYLSIGAIAGLVALSLKLLPRRKLASRTLVMLSTLAMLKFFARELNLGQVNAVMALVALAGLAWLKADRPVRAGLALALSVVVKPYAIVFLPYLILRRRLIAAGAMLVAVIVVLLLPAAIYGPSGNAAQLKGWIRTIAQSTPENLLNPDNVSIWAMYAKWFGIGPLAFYLAAGTIAVLGGVFLALVRKGFALPDGEVLEMAVLLALLPLLSPQGWDYVLLIATPAVMLLVNEFRALPAAARAVSGAAVAVMALSLFDLMGRQAYATFMALSAITVCALILIASLVAIRWRRIA